MSNQWTNQFIRPEVYGHQNSPKTIRQEVNYCRPKIKTFTIRIYLAYPGTPTIPYLMKFAIVSAAEYLTFDDLVEF